MRCEKCHKNEATIHLTEVVARSSRIRKGDFCEACFRESESELLKRPHLVKVVDNLRAHQDNRPGDELSR
jgi:protein-arginine kinase activator protein McsA